MEFPIVDLSAPSATVCTKCDAYVADEMGHTLWHERIDQQIHDATYDESGNRPWRQ